MKFLIKLLTIIFIIVSIPKADTGPHFGIYSYESPPKLNIKLYFNGGNLVKIDSGYKIRSILGGSAVEDSLIIYVSLPKIRVKSLSFSRNDTVYCYANKFPPSDSLKWRLFNPDIHDADTLKLRDSILEFGLRYPHRVMEVIWHLKKKYTFNSGDTFTLILAEFPYIPPSNTLPQKNPAIKPVNSRQSKMFIFMDARTDWYRMEEQVHDPIFDVSGKRQLFAPKSSFIFIMPVAGR